jgi:chitinase
MKVLTSYYSIFYSGDFDDPNFDRIMKLDKEITETFGKGMIEDMFPWMVKIRPSAKYHRFMDIINETFDILGSQTFL